MVSEHKKKLVAHLTEMVKKFSVIGVINMSNLPAQQLQNMREMLRARGVEIIMARKKLLKRALEGSGQENILQLTEKMKGMPALLFSTENPFSLYSQIQKNKSSAPAKGGQEAPRDIEVKAGPTSFAPGPIISELASIGIKTKVDGGKLTILSDTIVTKEGEVITAKVAEMLKRLEIQPMEVGLNLVAVWENGLVYLAKQLHIDEAEFTSKIIQAAKWSVNLAMEAAIPTKETTELLIQKAFREAKTLAIEQGIINADTANELVIKAESQAQSVKKQANL